MDTTNAIDFRALQLSPIRREKQADVDPALEAFTFAWRPAGSMSLDERWLRAGEDEGARHHSPPRLPAPLPGPKLNARKLER
jgi:hypothetical protein